LGELGTRPGLLRVEWLLIHRASIRVQSRWYVAVKVKGKGVTDERAGTGRLEIKKRIQRKDERKRTGWAVQDVPQSQRNRTSTAAEKTVEVWWVADGRSAL
jgi:hypothetical protein